eukprot:1160495-Pelagomonas_calceolata.AAC.1
MEGVVITAPARMKLSLQMQNGRVPFCVQPSSGAHQRIQNKHPCSRILKAHARTHAQAHSTTHTEPNIGSSPCTQGASSFARSMLHRFIVKRMPAALQGQCCTGPGCAWPPPK